MTSLNEQRSIRYVNRQAIRGAHVPFGTRDHNALPLDTEDAIIGLMSGDEELALRDLGGIPTNAVKAHERTQDRFQLRVRELTLALISGLLSLLAWHRLMRDEVKLHVIQQSLLGGGGSLSDPIHTDGLIRRELDYLSRFADQISRQAPSSKGEGLMSRALLYGGSARAAFYREREANLPDGYVVAYEALDDTSTCDPCVRAVGVYLPGSGPYPGAVCFGRTRCRCTRVPQFHPDLALSLKVRS